MFFSIHCSVPSIEVAVLCCGQVDLPGLDLPRARDGAPARDAEACDCLCRRSRACVAWTFRAADERCWLKAAHGQAWGGAAGLVSGRPPPSGAHHEAAVGEAGVAEEAEVLQRAALPRVEVWHGRCEALEMRAARAAGALVVARCVRLDMGQPADARVFPSSIYH